MVCRIDTEPYGKAIDLDAPVLLALPAMVAGIPAFRVWCRYCGDEHYHRLEEGWVEAGCETETPYTATGYNLSWRRGLWLDDLLESRWKSGAD